MCAASEPFSICVHTAFSTRAKFKWMKYLFSFQCDRGCRWQLLELHPFQNEGNFLRRRCRRLPFYVVVYEGWEEEICSFGQKFTDGPFKQIYSMALIFHTSLDVQSEREQMNNELAFFGNGVARGQCQGLWWKRFSLATTIQKLFTLTGHNLL